MGADWNDIEAAIEVAATKAEFAMLEVQRHDESEWRGRIVTIEDEEGVITIRREGPDAVGLECRVGRFGNPDRERRIVGALAQRLRALHGVDTAPLR